MASSLGLDKGKQISLEFGPDFVQDNYRLFELSDELYDELLKDEDETGQKPCFVIKGQSNAEAVLCTNTKTFQVKTVESSNSQLLIAPTIHESIDVEKELSFAEDDDEDKTQEDEDKTQGGSPSKRQKTTGNDKSKTDVCYSAVIEGSATFHYELVEIMPKLDLLRKILLSTAYSGDEDEEEEYMKHARARIKQAEDAQRKKSKQEVDEIDDKGRGEENKFLEHRLFTTQDLQKTVQASDSQLFSALGNLKAVKLHGFWRVLAREFQAEVLQSIIDTANTHEWSLSALGISECVSQLTQYEPAIVKHVLRTHSTKDKNSPDVCSLDEDKVALVVALQIFEKKSRWTQEQFESKWYPLV